MRQAALNNWSLDGAQMADLCSSINQFFSATGVIPAQTGSLPTAAQAQHPTPQPGGTLHPKAGQAHPQGPAAGQPHAPGQAGPAQLPKPAQPQPQPQAAPSATSFFSMANPLTAAVSGLASTFLSSHISPAVAVVLSLTIPTLSSRRPETRAPPRISSRWLVRSHF